MESYQYWMLNENAFDENAGSKFFFGSTIHQEALDRLHYIIESKNMGLGLLTGEIGSGKTMTRNVLIENIIDNSYNYEFAVMDTSNFTFVDILLDVFSQLSNQNPADLPNSKYKLYSMFKNYIETKLIPHKKKVVIILDEAQKISPLVLDSLKDLTNIVYNNQSIVTIILIGQPELSLKLRKLPQIDQRISLKYHMNYLSLDDTHSYINYRQFASGSTREIFSKKAIELIYYKTHGIPREINRACRIALDFGYTEELDMITENEMNLIFNDFE